MQVINNAVHLLMQAHTFPLKEFNDWEAVTPKTYPAPKIFIVAVYTRRIMAQQLRNTAGQQGYVPTSHNMYNMFADKDNADTAATATTNIAVLMTGSSITATIPKLVANAINQLSANQTAFMDQMAAMSYANIPPLKTNSTNHQSRNSPFQCSNLLLGLHLEVVQPWKWRRWQGGAQQTGMWQTWGQS
jgi:hypothetical protein